ncbi:AAA family ATPase [Hydromonas duriensis]|uniref:NadR type nicotinamide-nucleotide adenylyltransferase n=1 Tax=Hydromonas duriensis TaxID=1527608 RepID=A0A4R6Y7W0_9BURK|nr:AAA family ATPase [Hydromonas duriensis]TDR31427.1 NadR type nicotinamide-nucleotide adenylyltransferase [Hydromonas duriensis]
MKKIAVIGPESTGKSTLVTALAAHFNCPFMPEYAREFLQTHGAQYTFNDVLTIARNQLRNEERIIAEHPHAPYVFIDTDMHIMHVWCTVVFGRTHDFIEEARAQNRYDLYLLTRPDLPWVADEMREYPQLEIRERLFNMYKDILEHQTTPWAEIHGQGEARMNRALLALTSLT